jgi:DNA-binding response OmpR family regulator
MGSGAAGTGDTVLVVDDDEELQRMLRLAFESKGFRVEQALDGLAAVDFLKAHRVDLTVLDLFLPTMDGWAVLEQMKCFARRPPVVVISGVAEVNVTPRVFREGVEAFIAKPFQLGTLLNACAQLIARAKGRVPFPERRQRGARRTLTLPVTIRDGEDRLLHAGRLLNLGLLGAQVELPAPLAPGQRVRVAYSADAGAPLTVDGCVQWWQHPDPSSPATSVGISFTGVSAEQQKRIKEIAALE